MSVTYRLIREAEVDAALDLWGEQLPANREEIERDFLADPGRLSHVQVAVAADGRLLSAVHYYLRYLRNVDGLPELVGGVSHVATQEDAQRQGHAGQLMERTITAMRREGCTWSLLFTEANNFYKRWGWHTMPTRYRQGLLSGSRPEGPAAYTTRRYQPLHEAGGWAALAVVYDAYNRGRPLTVVRDLSYWETYLAPRFTAPGTTILVVTRTDNPSHLSGYILVTFFTEVFGVTEVAVLPGDEGAIPVLLSAVVNEAVARGLDRGRAYLPVEPVVDAALECIYRRVILDYHHVLMARPLSPDCSMTWIEEIFGAPGAIPWPADDF